MARARHEDENGGDPSHWFAVRREIAKQTGKRGGAGHGDAVSRRVMPKLAREALEAHPDGINTRAIALHVIEAKGLDASDRHLRKAIAYKVVQVLRRQEKRSEVSRAGKRQGAVVWRL